MRKRIVTLGSGKRVGLGNYVAGVRTAIANPDVIYAEGLTGFGSRRGSEIRREFLRGLHDRINTGVPYRLIGGAFSRFPRQGRKWGEDWYSDMRFATRRVNTPRLLVRSIEVPPEIRRRLAHRFSD